MPVLMTLILCSYPLIVHLSVYFGHVVWAAYFLATFFALPLPYYLIRWRRPNWLIVLSTTYSILIFWLAGTQAETLLFAQPIIINSLIFLIFISSLFGNSGSLIGRFAKIIKPDASNEIMEYCRWVTWAWALFFLVMAVLSWFLSAYASIEAWSWFTNVLTYILVGLMFIVEYIVRKILMKDFIDRSFIQFIRDLRQVDYRQVARQWWL
ncbi:MAG: hypothetical protein BMS9Abin36_0732 [Gammaproteobacteria bacterium]|nr:MAG: hypothetical protein BMS9Abin36_0732 [Gammaproteobacteria bacterium]